MEVTRILHSASPFLSDSSVRPQQIQQLQTQLTAQNAKLLQLEHKLHTEKVNLKQIRTALEHLLKVQDKKHQAQVDALGQEVDALQDDMERIENAYLAQTSQDDF